MSEVNEPTLRVPDVLASNRDPTIYDNRHSVTHTNVIYNQYMQAVSALHDETLVLIATVGVGEGPPDLA
jgi:hypothetical protein